MNIYFLFFFFSGEVKLGLGLSNVRRQCAQGEAPENVISKVTAQLFISFILLRHIVFTNNISTKLLVFQVF